MNFLIVIASWVFSPFSPCILFCHHHCFVNFLIVIASWVFSPVSSVLSLLSLLREFSPLVLIWYHHFLSDICVSSLHVHTFEVFFRRLFFRVQSSMKIANSLWGFGSLWITCLNIHFLLLFSDKKVTILCCTVSLQFSVMVLLSQFLALSAQIIMYLGNGAVEQFRLLFMWKTYWVLWQHLCFHYLCMPWTCIMYEHFTHVMSTLHTLWVHSLKMNGTWTQKGLLTSTSVSKSWCDCISFLSVVHEEEGYSVNMLLFSFCDQGGVKSRCVCQAPFSKAAVKCTAVPPRLHPRKLGQTRLHWKWTWQLTVSIAYGLYAKWWAQGNCFSNPFNPFAQGAKQQSED